MVVPTESDAPSYFRVRVPSSAPALKISVEADRPVAFFAALGYFPKESHYDISNFPAWAIGALYSDIHVPLKALRESPCEGAPGALESCLVRATTTEDALRCGKAPPVGDTAVNASVAAPLPHLVTPEDIFNPTADGQQRACVKGVDTCTEGVCRSRRGPTMCTMDLEHAGEGQCLCQQGFCAVSGRCINADSSQATCMKITGTVCPYYACDDSLGPTNCEDGLCACAPGHCSIGGVCYPGEMCREVGMRGMCEAVPPEKRRLLALKSKPSATDPCCEVINGARTREPGRFARCAARHFFSLDHAHARGIHFPLLADLSEEGQPVDELVVAVRTSATVMRAPNAIGDSRQGEVEVRLKLLQDLDADVHPAMGGNSTSTKLSSLYHFRTYQELVAPPLDAFGGLPPMVLQLEAPLLLPEVYAFNPELDADKPVDHIPNQAVRLHLRRQELLTLRLGEDALLMATAPGVADASGGGAFSGILQLHIVDLPPGSRVLYSHAHPEPRSLMAFGHAQLVDSVESVSGRPRAGIWRAPLAERSARFFAILPSADAHAAAFFAVHAFGPPDTNTRLAGLGGPPPPLPTEIPGGEESRSEDLTGAAAARAVTRTLCLGAALSLAGAAAWAWCWKVVDQNASGGLRDKQRPYMAVSGTDVELAPAISAADASSDDDVAGGRSSRAVLGVAARAKISSLRVFGEAVKEKLGQTGALLSASTRAGTSRFSASSRRSIVDEVDGRADLFQDAHSPDRCPHTAEEAQGLLNASYIDDEDEEEVLVSPSPGASRASPGTRSPDSRSHSGKSKQAAERSPSGIDSGSKADLEALSALMKLRPAARDSVGNDDDDEELSGRPLIGTGRTHSLSR